MTQTLTAADARNRFDELIGRIATTGERVVIMLDDGGTIAMVPGAALEQLRPARDLDPIRTELDAIHEMLRRELDGRTLDPDPVEMLRRVRNEEFE